MARELTGETPLVPKTDAPKPKSAGKPTYKPTVKAAVTREDSERSGQGSIIHRVTLFKRSADKTAVRTIGGSDGVTADPE